MSSQQLGIDSQMRFEMGEAVRKAISPQVWSQTNAPNWHEIDAYVGDVKFPIEEAIRDEPAVPLWDWIHALHESYITEADEQR